MPHHNHAHSHDHHHHGHAQHDTAFAIGAGLNAAFVLAEAGFGLAANSVALLADAAHNLGDVAALLLAWGAAWLARRPPTQRRTYGWGRSSIMAALINAMVLLIGVGAIAVEAIRRVLEPEPVGASLVIWVAAAGILVNGSTAMLFVRDRSQDLNIRAQFVHLAADALVSLGVMIAAFLIGVTGWLWLDPVTSLAIVLVITIGTWGILRESVNMATDAVPESVSRGDVQGFLERLPGVVEVHDLHIWSLSTTDTALTAHLVYAGTTPDRSLHDLSVELRQRFSINHTTIQIETGEDAAECRLRPDHVV